MCAFESKLKKSTYFTVNLFLLLFISLTVLFDTIYKSHYTILINFYLYLQYIYIYFFLSFKLIPKFGVPGEICDVIIIFIHVMHELYNAHKTLPHDFSPSFYLSLISHCKHSDSEVVTFKVDF